MFFFSSTRPNPEGFFLSFNMIKKCPMLHYVRVVARFCPFGIKRFLYITWIISLMSLFTKKNCGKAIYSEQNEKMKTNYR